jgi:hypothetical protein
MLRENEFPIMQNVDMSNRGSSKRRAGRYLLYNLDAKGQGMAQYYRSTTSSPDLIIFKGGKFYLSKASVSFVPENSATYPSLIEIPIQNDGSRSI